MRKIQSSTFNDRSEADMLLLNIKTKSDKILGITLFMYFAFGIFLSFYYDTFIIAIGVGGLSLLAFFGSKLLLPNSNLYQYVGSAVLAVFMAQFIYQMHGLFEMHFFVFVGSILLITYQNWKLQLPLAIVVVVHHSVFAYLQYSGVPEVYFTQLEYMDLQTFIFHAGLAAVIFFISGYWAYDLRINTLAGEDKITELNTQITHVQNNIIFADEISKGNLQYVYQIKEGDTLGASLLKMRDSLITANKREQEEKFISLGINKVAEILRSNTDGIEQLSDALIRGLVKYLGVNQGAIFIVQGEDDYQELELKSCYAFDRKKFLEKRLKTNEGLVGQCFMEQDMIYLTEVPSEYIRITSGLGDAPPNAVLMMPIKTNDETVGVIELAAFKTFTENEIEFVKKACENIASAIISAHTTDKIKALLEESQIQAEEMRAQEEEMRQNMEEMAVTQEQLSNSMEEMNRLKSLAEESLKKSEKLSLVADNTDNSVIITSAKGLIEYVNEGFTKMTGYSLEESIGKKLGSFLQGPDTDKNTVKRMREKLDRKEAFYDEILNYDKQGKEYWISLAINPVFENGELKNYIAVQANVTETKRAALYSHYQLSAINETNAIIQFDLSGNIQEANELFLTTMGYTLDEIKGKHHSMFVENEYAQSKEYSEFWQKLNRAEFHQGQFARVAKDGSKVWIDGTYAPIFDIKGKPSNVIKIAKDITAQKQLENEVIIQAKISSDTFEQAIDSVITINANKEIIFYNQSAERMFGYKREEVLGQNVKMIVPLEHRQNHDNYVDNNIKGGENKVVGIGRELMASRKDGSQFWILLTLSRVSVEGRIQYTAFIKDISKQKEQEFEIKSQLEEIRANEEELRQNLEELQATQELIEKQMKEAQELKASLEVREMVFGQTTILSEADTYGNILMVNDKLCEVSKYSREELIGKPHNIFRHEDMPKELFKIFWEIIKSGQTFKGIVKNRAKDGSHYWADASIVPVKDENGKITKYIGARYHILDDEIAIKLYNAQALQLGLKPMKTVSK